MVYMDDGSSLTGTPGVPVDIATHGTYVVIVTASNCDGCRVAYGYEGFELQLSNVIEDDRINFMINLNQGGRFVFDLIKADSDEPIDQRLWINSNF